MTANLGVVVGYDGSDFSMQALEWATDEAELRGCPLTVVHAWSWPYGEAPDEVKLHLRKAAEHVLWHGADCARNTASISDVCADLYEGAAADRLTRLSGEAELVVVGSRGLGALPRMAVGSVAERVATGALCDVVVVRGPGPIPVSAHPGPVVVGVDGGPGESVMDFACQEARRRNLTLLALRAASVRPMSWGTAMPPVPDVDAVGRAAEEDLRAALEPWRARYPEVRMQARVVDGRPRDVLLEASRQATLLVMGHRRPDHLGSITRAMLQRAACPVAVAAFEPVRVAHEIGPRSVA